MRASRSGARKRGERARLRASGEAKKRAQLDCGVLRSDRAKDNRASYETTRWVVSAKRANEHSRVPEKSGKSARVLERRTNRFFGGKNRAGSDSP